MDEAAFLARVQEGPIDHEQAKELTGGHLAEAIVLGDAVRTLRALRPRLPAGTHRHDAEVALIDAYRETLVALALGVMK